MTRDEFSVYIEHFNNKEYIDLTKYFSDDIIVEYFDNFTVDKQSPKTLRGKEEFVASYTNLHKKFREYLELGFFLYDGTTMAVELYTEFHALDDASFSAGTIKKGETLCVTNWVCYNFSPDGRFSHIRIAHFRNHDPSTRRFDPRLRP